MDADDSLNERLTVLARAGWQLRTCYTLRRPDKQDESWQSFHGDTLEAVVARAEREAKPRRVEAVEPKPAELPPGWTALEPVRVREGETRFGAEKLFPGDGKPALQASATEAGLLKACMSYDAHKAGDAEPNTGTADETARMAASSKVSTGLSHTGNTPY